jgi:hypothetical protein
MLSERIQMFFNSVYSEAIEWCRGRGWKWRLLLLIWFGYILYRHLSNPMYTSIIGGLNLGIHELGHMLFSFFGEFIGIAGGTIVQLLLPVFGVVNFYRQRDFFAIALCFGWLSTNLFNVSVYVSDARSMELPLVAVYGNENTLHDWNYLLSKLGILQFDSSLAFLIKSCAVLAMLICFFLGGWLLLQMKKNPL